MSYSKLLKQYTPCGAQTLSKMACRYPSIYPKVLSHGKDGHVWDENGAEFIDLIAALGAVSVGYAHPSVNEAISRQMRSGASFSLPHALEYHVAKKLTELVPNTDMWKFGKNGTDGTVMAVRAARAYTGRTKIMTVGYNGCADQFEIKGTRKAGIPSVLDPTIEKAEYNNYTVFKRLVNFEDYACVLMEPMIFDYPEVGFLETIREWCDKSGTLLIFDEVVTGGRFEKFTAQSYLQVVPDLTVLGKAIANGLPLCAVGGRRPIMETFERDDFFASGTFGGECLSLAAFLETQDVLVKSIEKMVVQGTNIKATFNIAFEGLAECKGYPTRLSFTFPSDTHKYLFWQEMCKRGVLVGYTEFIMASHTDEDVEKICNAIQDSAQYVKEWWRNPSEALIGALPYAALRK